ncbi:MAG: hypothetical protein KIT22_15520, partial [Verrucomicrobiae bacterium]|nr:hypothetical protein [Verrucomicrobiae bacterium]
MSRDRKLAGRYCGLAAALLLAAGGSAAEKGSDKVIPAQPPLPEITGLRLEPSSLVLEDARDARTVLVAGERADGGVVDLTSQAHWTADSDSLAVDEEGFISGRSPG